MQARWTALIGGFGVALTSVSLVIPLSGQGVSPDRKPRATSSARSSTPSRTPWGDPDLQGQWNSQTSTPLQRPLAGPLAARDSLSQEEAETLEETNRRSFDQAPTAGDPGTYNAFWRDSGKALTRTSLIIDPPDGRIPPFTTEGQYFAAKLETEEPGKRYKLIVTIPSDARTSHRSARVDEKFDRTRNVAALDTGARMQQVITPDGFVI